MYTALTGVLMVPCNSCNSRHKQNCQVRQVQWVSQWHFRIRTKSATFQSIKGRPLYLGTIAGSNNSTGKRESKRKEGLNSRPFCKVCQLQESEPTRQPETSPQHLFSFLIIILLWGPIELNKSLLQRIPGQVKSIKCIVSSLKTKLITYKHLLSPFFLYV